ncbi:hypothetical protein [Streptomyces sp. NPDC056524]|uniref:hypothetical protein n=1 Tax=Streptomyces sp. NPDC056524 TaxID=3345851 RepID=UPI0036AB7ACA
MGAHTVFPLQNSGCQDGRKSELYCTPLDDAGRSQGAIACINWHDINNVDKNTGEMRCRHDARS